MNSSLDSFLDESVTRSVQGELNRQKHVTFGDGSEALSTKHQLDTQTQRLKEERNRSILWTGLWVGVCALGGILIFVVLWLKMQNNQKRLERLEANAKQQLERLDVEFVVEEKMVATEQRLISAIERSYSVLYTQILNDLRFTNRPSQVSPVDETDQASTTPDSNSLEEEETPDTESADLSGKPSEPSAQSESPEESLLTALEEATAGETADTTTDALSSSDEPPSPPSSPSPPQTSNQ